MQSKAATVDAYLAELPDDRRRAVERIREVFQANIDPSLREGMQYGMIGYFIPHEVYPPGYHCDPNQPVPYAAIASQKQHIAVYLCAMYLDVVNPGVCARMRSRFLQAGPRLDLGKSCIRFKRLEDFPLDALATALREIDGAAYLRAYQTVLANRPGAARPAGKTRARGTSKAAAGMKPAKPASVQRGAPAGKCGANGKTSRAAARGKAGAPDRTRAARAKRT